MGMLSVGQVATQLGTEPRAVTNLLYNRRIDTSRCLLVAGRRLIPADLVPDIEAALRAQGKLQAAAMPT